MTRFQKLSKRYRYSLILLRELVITDFKLRYQGSALGYVWSLLKPLFLFAVLYTIFGLILNLGKDIEHWPVALLLGLVLWNFFGEITSHGMTSVAGRGGLMKKLNFPRYVIIFASAMSAAINLLLSTVIIIIFMIINSVHISWGVLIGLLFLLEIFLFSVGLAFFLSAAFVKYRDVQHIWDVVKTGGFYASAIFFPMTRIIEATNDRVAQILMMNPIGQAIQDVRHYAISDTIPNLHSISGSWVPYLIPVSLSVVTFVFGALYFRKKSPYFAEEV